MTHHTDAELLPCPFCGCAANFEMDDDRWEWIECGSCGMEGNRSASLMEDCKPKLAEAWSRRAPAAPVPQGWKLVPDDANMTDEQAEAICAVAKVCGGGAYDIYRAALAAAPQPPEGLKRENPATKPEAAPVQLPEPCGIFNYGKDDGKPTYHHGETDKEWLNKVLDDGVTGGPHRSEYAYTEQQVRDLLAEHGIKVNQ